MSQVVHRRLQWRLAWKPKGHPYERYEHFDDIEKLKRARNAALAMVRAGLCECVRTEERYPEVAATPWVRPSWVKPVQQ